jgi:hypothetical protein
MDLGSLALRHGKGEIGIVLPLVAEAGEGLCGSVHWGNVSRLLKTACEAPAGSAGQGGPWAEQAC